MEPGRTVSRREGLVRDVAAYAIGIPRHRIPELSVLATGREQQHHHRRDACAERQSSDSSRRDRREQRMDWAGPSRAGSDLETGPGRSEEHPSEIRHLMGQPYAAFVLKKKKK